VYELSDRQLPRQQINNVRGAAVALLRGLQTAAGTGGSAHGRFIELQVGEMPGYVHTHNGFPSGRAGLTDTAWATWVQGDHQRMVELFLVRAACIKGLTRDNFPAGTAPPPKKVA
jgi:hypothetical protein